MHTLLALFCVFLPWPLKKWVMRTLMGYRIEPFCYIGLSLLSANNVELKEGASIGHFTVIRNLDQFTMGERAYIGNFNWITGLKSGHKTSAFVSEPDRRSYLILNKHAAVMHRHIIDCTNVVTIGAYTLMAGYRSQILTHAIDIAASRQTSAPVTIGKYCLIGTGCLLLKGSQLPDRCVIGAGGVLTTAYSETDCLYAGVPAKKIKTLNPQSAYFLRNQGCVT